MISKVLGDPSQRENLFNTKCLIKGVMCSRLVDGGSFTNISSSTLVDVLRLPTIRHSRPYNLQWLNECGELKVNRQVVRRFKVGNYFDKVLCDVIPMQACHLLLLRPWK